MYVLPIADAVVETARFLPVLSLYASVRWVGEVPGGRTPRARKGPGRWWRTLRAIMGGRPPYRAGLPHGPPCPLRVRRPEPGL